MVHDFEDSISHLKCATYTVAIIMLTASNASSTVFLVDSHVVVVVLTNCCVGLEQFEQHI